MERFEGKDVLVTGGSGGVGGAGVRGAIVTLPSTDAFAAESPQTHYNASKAALVMMTRSFAHELGHLRVRCNCVAPGETLTPMLGDDMDQPAFRPSYLARIPMRRGAAAG